ncbi:hypothetical protein [Azonexus hydrophilus]|uniref:Uncharacterized protein n=1 Tax=Azonexus hydrophilus TaxID=418702 RepID=A0ABZ2XN79_9RHOO
MKNQTFVLELTKTIVIEVEAENETAANKLAENNDYEDDGAWDRAEPKISVLDVRGPKNSKCRP